MSDSRAKKLVLQVARRVVLGRPADDREPGGPLRRLVDRVSGIVFPVNKSGNNMSVR